MEQTIEEAAKEYANSNGNYFACLVSSKINAFKAGAEWQRFQQDSKWKVELSPWTSVNVALPNVDTPVLVVTKNGNYIVTKLYQPYNSKGKPIGNISWKGSSTLRDSIIAWMYIPEFKF